jgi:hypothetical protein
MKTCESCVWLNGNNSHYQTSIVSYFHYINNKLLSPCSQTYPILQDLSQHMVSIQFSRQQLGPVVVTNRETEAFSRCYFIFPLDPPTKSWGITQPEQKPAKNNDGTADRCCYLKGHLLNDQSSLFGFFYWSLLHSRKLAYILSCSIWNTILLCEPLFPLEQWLLQQSSLWFFFHWSLLHSTKL